MSDQPADQLDGAADPSPEARAAACAEFLARIGLADLSAASLDLALSHRSYVYESGLEADNERLEFLGDSLIAGVTSEYLYARHPRADEGELSKLRARLVSRSVLGRCAREMGLGGLMLLGRGERSTGGAKRRSILGSALEALAGAVYLELGFERMKRFVREAILEPLAVETDTTPWGADFKSQLQEWTQKHLRSVPKYRRLGDEGPDHAKVFHVHVEIGGRVAAEGRGSRVKDAENDAAREAWTKIESGEFQAE